MPTHRKPLVVYLCALCALCVGLLLPPRARAQSQDDLSSSEMQGTIGPYTIGLNHTVRHNTQLVAAHYFYATQLKDIPLTGTVQGENVEFKGADGSTFHLHFTGNGSQGKAPLTFYNSIGLAGTWTLNGRTLPVKLTGGYSTANPGQPLYGLITTKPDAEVEARIQAAQKAILSNDPKTAAPFITFPLLVNRGRQHLRIRNAQELQANWSAVFTPALLAKLRTFIPHEMFCRDQGIMLGSGELWFDDKGLTSVNVF